jgi:hypothetical protein
MDTKVEQLPRDFIAASHVARLAIQLANIGQSTPEQELSRAWRLIEVARVMVREHAGFRPVVTVIGKAFYDIDHAGKDPRKNRRNYDSSLAVGRFIQCQN